MKDEKPIIIFTTFWDAEFMLDHKCCIFYHDNQLRIAHLNSENYSPYIFSIALAHPELTHLPIIQEKFHHLPRLDFFCPTYRILRQYKEDKNWENYTGSFNHLIRIRKKEIREWVLSLSNNRVYILCCWENTSRGANCHRKLLYDAFTKSKTLKDKAIYIYKYGTKVYVKNSRLYNEMIGTRTIGQDDLRTLYSMLGSYNISEGSYNISDTLQIGTPVIINHDGTLSSDFSRGIPIGITTHNGENQTTIQVNSNMTNIFRSLMEDFQSIPPSNNQS